MVGVCEHLEVTEQERLVGVIITGVKGDDAKRLKERGRSNECLKRIVVDGVWKLTCKRQ